MVKSSNGPWGFFDPAGRYDPSLSYDDQWYVKGQPYTIQLVGIILSIIVIGSLFAFKKYYRKTTDWKWFRISIGLYQIISYIAYYTIMVVYLGVVLKQDVIWSTDRPHQVQTLPAAMPLHLTSMLQLLSGVLLIFPNQKLFELTAPSALILPFVAILTPVNAYWTFDNFFYWNYFIEHFLIIFAYLYVYCYGINVKRYSGEKLKWQIVFVTTQSFIALGWNYVFKLNLLFVGPYVNEYIKGGFNIGGWNTNYINGQYAYPFSWFVMFWFGFVFICLTHFLMYFIPIFYHNKEVVPKYENKMYCSREGITYILLTYRFMFIKEAQVNRVVSYHNLEKYYIPFNKRRTK